MKRAKKFSSAFLLVFAFAAAVTSFSTMGYGQIPTPVAPLPLPAPIPATTPHPTPSPTSHFTQFSGPYTLVSGPAGETARAHADESTRLQPVPVTTQQAETKTYKLQNLRAAEFERKLLEKLGKRFVPVRNLDGAENVAHFRLPGKDGSNVELLIDRQHDSATVVGSVAMINSCVKIVQLLDVRETESSQTRFLPVNSANLIPVKQAAEILNQHAVSVPANGRAHESEVRFAPQNNLQPNPQNNAGVVLGPVQIDIIDEFGTLAIRGPKRDVEQIQAMLQDLEAMSLEYEPVIELVELKHGDSYRVNMMVQQLYQQVYQARRGNVPMLPLVKPNTILLAGQKDSVATAKELIAKLDTPVGPEMEFQILRLKNASSDQLVTQITNFYNNPNQAGQGLEGRVYAVSDTRTNALIIQASPRDMTAVVEMIRQLDTPGSEAVNTVKTFSLKNAMASELASTLQDAITGTTTGAGGAAFGGGGGGGNQAGRTRNPMLTMGEIDADGNLKKSSVLYDVRIVADTRSNTLIVTAPVDTMPLIEALIKELDQLPSAEAQIKVFTLVNADAYTLANTVLTSLFAQTTTGGGGGGFGGGAGTNQIATVRPGIEEGESTLVSVRFVPDIRTNSIIACGSAGDMAVVEAILLRLDEENMNNRKVMVFKPMNSRASEIAAALQNYAQNERTLENQNSTYLLPQSPLEQYRKEIVPVADDITNTLIVSTTPRYYDLVRKLVQELDERPLMVGIQVLIAEVRMNNSRERGIEIGLQDSLLFDRSLLGENGQRIPGFLFGNPNNNLPLGDVNSGNVGSQGITSLGVGRVGASGIGGFTFAASSESVSVLVRALEQRDKLRILSRPFLTTLHDMRATVKVGQDVPFPESANSGGNNNGTTTTTGWREVGTILDITPRITPDGQIVMAVYVEKSSMGSEADGTPMYVSEGEVIRTPKVNQTNAQTNVSARDGQTIVFAGLITEQKETMHRSVPFLNKIPVVKRLFEYESHVNQRSELLIILTPKIIRSELDMEMLRQQEGSRMHWCLSDVVKLTGNSHMTVRGDLYRDGEIPYTQTEPVILDDSQLPSEEKVRKYLPVPVLAPGE